MVSIFAQLNKITYLVIRISYNQFQIYIFYNLEPIDFNEFTLLCKKIPAISEKDLIKAFKRMDTDNNGFISKEEFIKSATSVRLSIYI